MGAVHVVFIKEASLGAAGIRKFALRDGIDDFAEIHFLRSEYVGRTFRG